MECLDGGGHRPDSGLEQHGLFSFAVDVLYLAFIPSDRIKAVADKLQDSLSAVAARLKHREVASGAARAGACGERFTEPSGSRRRPAGTDPGKGFRWPEDVRTRLTD